MCLAEIRQKATKYDFGGVWIWHVYRIGKLFASLMLVLNVKWLDLFTSIVTCCREYLDQKHKSHPVKNVCTFLHC